MIITYIGGLRTYIVYFEASRLVTSWKTKVAVPTDREKKL